MASEIPEGENPERSRTLTDDEIVTERKLPRRSFLAATGTLLAGGAAVLVAGKKGLASSRTPQSQDPDKKQSDPDQNRASDGDKDKGADSSRRRQSDPDKKTDPDRKSDPDRKKKGDPDKKKTSDPDRG